MGGVTTIPPLCLILVHGGLAVSPPVGRFSYPVITEETFVDKASGGAEGTRIRTPALRYGRRILNGFCALCDLSPCDSKTSG